MTPEHQQALETHVNEIAKILYADALEQGLSMNGLGEIEQAVRRQLQTHVSPDLGLFLSTPASEKTVEPRES